RGEGMIEARWRRIESLFQSALDRDRSERDSYLEEACGGDEELYREVKSLLTCHEESSFLKTDAVTLGLRAIEQRSAFGPGQQLGPYRIEAQIAAGGMGFVYRALDTRLQRQVAIKVLRLGLLGEKGRTMLQREARSIAQLQHPNICALHDIGEQDGRDFLVMEYLAGDTLAERLRRKPLDVPQALEFAIQIAAALEQAHRRGVIHRDLKPGNVIIIKNTAKLLDFGLASLHMSTPENDPEDQVTELPLTGTLTGTLPYMAPEQIRGEPVDARTDIFSFGLVLYEMLSGRRAFPQRERPELATAILNEAPPALPRISPALERLLSISLAKDPDERWQSAGDLRRELIWIAGLAAEMPQPRRKWRIALGVAATALCVMAAGWAGYYLHPVPVAHTFRFSLQPPAGATYRSNVDLALSPNGEQLAFNAVTPDGKTMLWIRPLNELTARVLPGSEEARFPFWSPDSRHLAFFAKGRLMRVDPSGGTVQKVCDAPGSRSGTWGPNEKILFNPIPLGTLHAVDASGGSPVPVTALDKSFEDVQHVWPSFLPDGRHFLFSAFGSRHAGMLYVGSLDSKKAKFLFKSSGRAHYRSGRLYFVNGGLKSQPFDPKRLELTGEPTTVVESLESGAGFDIAQTGTLVYRIAGPSARELVWLDRSGKQVSKPFGRDLIRAAAVAPDGNTVATVLAPSGFPKISLWKLPHLERTPLTQNAARDAFPVWSPDGKQLAYASDRTGHQNVFLRLMDGSGSERPVSPSDTEKVPESWSSDSRYLSVTERVGQVFQNWVIPFFGERKEFRFPESKYSVSMGFFSPDGKWMAYWTDEPGHAEIFIASFPDAAVRRRVSTDGGEYPQWAKDGRELYYVNSKSHLIAMPISTRDKTVVLGRPRSLGELPRSSVGPPYSVSNDGRILAMFDPDAVQPRPIVVVMNAATAQTPY
ncbi:MAG: serine/threonine-protein kinase, partial [Acidobacteriota bacterium]|nr:serine/threonine-protein kinase [Acidobacteriota bacterium]